MVLEIGSFMIMGMLIYPLYMQQLRTMFPS